MTVTEPEPDEYELYDLTLDPIEERNLAHPSHADDASRPAEHDARAPGRAARGQAPDSGRRRDPGLSPSRGRSLTSNPRHGAVLNPATGARRPLMTDTGRTRLTSRLTTWPTVIRPPECRNHGHVGTLSLSLSAPGAAELDRSRSFPDEDRRALGDAGALGLLVPVEQGGAGGGLTALVEACEVIGGASGSTGMVFLMHAVATATVAGGGGERATELLARMGERQCARHPGVQRAGRRRISTTPSCEPSSTVAP